MQNSKINWLQYKEDTIISGIADNGLSLLELFLTDYTKEFSEIVNPNCNNCLTTYINKYKRKIMTENNKCDYKLKKAIATGITLKFGSNVMVTNENITNELAEQMIDYRKSINSDFKLESLFEIYPKDKKKEIAKIEVVEPIVVKSENVKTDKK